MRRIQIPEPTGRITTPRDSHAGPRDRADPRRHLLHSSGVQSWRTHTAPFNSPSQQVIAEHLGTPSRVGRAEDR